MDKSKHGGARPNSGPKNLKPEEEKKVPVSFSVKEKHKAEAKRLIKPIIDDLNKQ